MLRLVGAFVAMLVLLLALTSAAPAAVDEEISTGTGVDAAQEELALVVVELVGTIAPISGLAIGVVCILVIVTLPGRI